MTDSRPIILISNDDGIEAPGLRYLIECVADMGRVIVAAPDGPRSGQASAITCDNPLRISQCPDFHGAQMWSVSGTPVDCVKLALNTVLTERPTLMVSGINHGSNSGNSVIYSGTMGAVIEGCMAGIPSVGFSLLHHSWKADFSQCGDIVRKVCSKVLERGLPEDICLNVNIPARCTPKGIKVTRASMGHWTEEYSRYEDPHGRPYYWLTGSYVDNDPDDPTTDNYWLDRQYATVVPVKPDQTSLKAIDEVKSLLG